MEAIGPAVCRERIIPFTQTLQVGDPLPLLQGDVFSVGPNDLLLCTHLPTLNKIQGKA